MNFGNYFLLKKHPAAVSSTAFERFFLYFFRKSHGSLRHALSCKSLLYFMHMASPSVNGG